MASIDSKFLLMGWLAGRAIASQRKRPTQAPVALLSSDGCKLKDSNGFYLYAKKG